MVVSFSLIIKSVEDNRNKIIKIPAISPHISFSCLVISIVVHPLRLSGCKE